MLPVENKITQWHGCYSDSWKDIIVAESFQHPAKMSYGLLKRILAHAKDKGWIHEGDVILDPFGGIGSTGILGAYEGYQVVCVELEQKFVDLAHKNFDLHRNSWDKLKCPFPGILQGDSRRLCELIEKADCVVGSPPFQESIDRGKMPESFLHNAEKKHGRKYTKKSFKDEEYGQTPGQLGAMKPGKVDMVVSSPPYAEGLGHGGKPTRGANRTEDTNLDAMQNGYGTTKGNLGNLKSGDLIISSPPFDTHVGGDLRVDNKKRATGGDLCMSSGKNFGQAPGQLALEQGDTFWAAAKEIVEQCHQILKPGGVAIWVVKAFVRNKAIVDFPGDWKRLCESVGFVTLCEHHAMLVKETKHKTLFGHTEVKRKERKSFFRRLAESKGSPRIDFEVVLCMSRPDGII